MPPHGPPDHEDAEVGKAYTGKVKRIMKFGAFVESPVSKAWSHQPADHNRVNQVEDVRTSATKSP